MSTFHFQQINCFNFFFTYGSQIKYCSMAFNSIILTVNTPLNAVHFEVCLPVGMMPQHQLKTLCNTVLVIICLHRTHQTITVRGTCMWIPR